MPYGADLATFLGSGYRFSLDGTLVGEVGGLTITNTGGITTGPALCLDVSNSYGLNGIGDRGTIPNTGSIDAASGSFAFQTWVRFTEAQLPFCRLLGQSNSTHKRTICIGPGNSVIYEADNDTFVAQRYADRNLQVNRNYHLVWIWDSNGLRGYLDGIEQTQGADFAQSSVTLSASSPIEIGDPTTGASIGGFGLVLVAPVTVYYNEIQYFDPAGLTDQQIFERCFADGAIPEYTVTNQAGMDAIADTVLGNFPVSIRIAVAGSIDLSADNITRNPLVQCDVHYTGTGVCNLTNTNGSNLEFGSAPFGTLNILNPSQLTINGLSNLTDVIVFESGTQNVVAEEYDITSGTYSQTISTPTVDIDLNSDDQKYRRFTGVDMSSDQTIGGGQIFDNNFLNP